MQRGGLPRESSEAIRAGKGGTTKRTRPAACGGARDVKFVPTQTPPLPFSFYRQRLFLCRAKKKGLNRLLASSGRENPRACGAAGGQHPQGVCRIRSAPSSLTAARSRPPLRDIGNAPISIRQIFNGRSCNDLYFLPCAQETRFYGRRRRSLT